MSRCITFWIFLNVLAVTGRAGVAECPDPVKIMDVVFSLERSDEPPHARIALFLDLTKSYEGCKAPRDSVYARILHRLGDLFRLTGDFEKGIWYTQEAVRINQNKSQTTSPSFLTNSYYNLGLYHALLSYFEKSNDYFDSCIQQGSRYDQKLPIVLMAYEQKSFNYFSMGEYQKSIDAADHGIFIAKKNNDITYQGVLLQQKAQSQLSLGLEQQAEVNGKTAVDILELSDTRREYLASAYAIYARMLAKKDPRSAISFYNKAIGLNKAAGNWSQCSRDYMDLGYLYDYTLRDSAHAIKSYRGGLDVIASSQDPYQVAGLYNNLGVVYWRNGSYKKALQYYQKGLTSLPVDFKDTSISANPSPGMIRYVSNDYFVSALLENKGESLLALFKSSGNKLYLHYALNAFRSADKVIDQMRRRQFHENSKLFWRKKTRKLYENAVETCYLLNDTESAFFFFEKSRAVLLNDKLNELGANKSLSGTEALKERELRSELFTLQQTLSDLPQESSLRAELQHKWYVAEQKFEKYVRNLEKMYPRYFQYKYDTTNVSIAEISKTLATENQTLILYFTSDTVIYSLTIGNGTSSLQRVSFPAFREKTNAYLDFCSTPSMLNNQYLEFVKTSNLLYERLFSDCPVKTKRVVVSFDDYFIPFESLLTNQHDPTSFLIKDHTFLYVYSAAYLSRRNDYAPVKNSILAVAPVLYQSGLNLSPLKGAENSLNEIVSRFREGFSLTKEAATKDSFIENFPNYPVVHIYSHAIADYNDAEPMLYFHDQPVFLKDLQMLPEVKTQLMVLSGCRTGVGKNVKGEGVLSLARGFAAVGIPSTVTTLWSVDDKVTYDIMEKFYSHLQKGSSYDEALQKAKLDFLQEHDGENHLPYYWASTVVLGTSTTLETTSLSRTNLFWWIVGITVVLSAAAILLRRRIRPQVFW